MCLIVTNLRRLKYVVRTSILTAGLIAVGLLSYGPVVAQTVVAANDSCLHDVMLVFDASGSMASAGYNEMEVPRMHQALQAVRKVIPEVAKTRRIGLLTYGPGPKDACSNINLKFAPLYNAAPRILKELEQSVPDGNTPLTKSVWQAAKVLEFQSRPGVIVLVTDGDETCGGAPCRTASDMAAAGFDLTVHVIGFKVRDKFFQWQSQAGQEPGETAARCLADQNNGKYISAESTDDLVQALRETLGCPLVSRLPGGKPVVADVHAFTVE